MSALTWPDKGVIRNGLLEGFIRDDYHEDIGGYHERVSLLGMSYCERILLR